MSVDVILQDPRWGEDLVELANAAFAQTLAYHNLIPGDWEVALLACNDAQIVELNAQFRNKPTATNVLSWPSEERGAEISGKKPKPPSGDPELGDIAIAYETCLKEARAGGRTLHNHSCHLIVHGFLHLLGYDHEQDGDGDLMEATEIAILAKLGVPNPYEG
ncbi:MAG: rRNA maturation RNase YbeY [Paracoccaceae bacterium]